MSIWSKNQVENWSAFAPDFTELDENVEYSEHESEFDEEDEDKDVVVDERENEKREDIDIDVETVKKIDAFCSSDEERESADFLFLPITPEVDDPEENPHAPQRDPTDDASVNQTTPQDQDKTNKTSSSSVNKRVKMSKKSAKRQKLR